MTFILISPDFKTFKRVNTGESHYSVSLIAKQITPSSLACLQGLKTTGKDGWET